jgi:hydroxypyruvate reductase
LLAAGTDGSDGPTDDAGALVDGGTVERGEAQGGRAAEALARADAGTFLEASGDLVHTGPTGTNVMDLILGIKTR